MVRKRAGSILPGDYPTSDAQFPDGTILQPGFTPLNSPGSQNIVLPGGYYIVDNSSPSGLLQGVSSNELSSVYFSGQVAGDAAMNPDGIGAAATLMNQVFATGQGGTFDDQRSGNWIAGFTPNSSMVDISNVNVGLWGAGAGETYEGVMSLRNNFGTTFSNNFGTSSWATGSFWTTVGFNLGAFFR